MNGTHDPAAHENPQQPAVPQGGPAYGPGYAQPAPAPVAATQRDPRAKSPVAACVLSAVPGLGQIYVGYYLRGFVHAVVVALLFALIVSGSSDYMLLPLLLVFMIFFWMYNIIDAGRRAALFNEALAGNQEIELPQDLKMPGVGGSIFGGLVLVGVGATLLAHTRFGVSLDWVADWWPALGILAGLYLLVKGIHERLASRDEKGE